MLAATTQSAARDLLNDIDSSSSTAVAPNAMPALSSTMAFPHHSIIPPATIAAEQYPTTNNLSISTSSISRKRNFNSDQCANTNQKRFRPSDDLSNDLNIDSASSSDGKAGYSVPAVQSDVSGPPFSALYSMTNSPPNIMSSDSQLPVMYANLQQLVTTTSPGMYTNSPMSATTPMYNQQTSATTMYTTDRSPVYASPGPNYSNPPPPALPTPATETSESTNFVDLSQRRTSVAFPSPSSAGVMYPEPTSTHIQSTASDNCYYVAHSYPGVGLEESNRVANTGGMVVPNYVSTQQPQNQLEGPPTMYPYASNDDKFAMDNKYAQSMPVGGMISPPSATTMTPTYPYPADGNSHIIRDAVHPTQESINDAGMMYRTTGVLPQSQQQVDYRSQAYMYRGEPAADVNSPGFSTHSPSVVPTPRSATVILDDGMMNSPSALPSPSIWGPPSLDNPQSAARRRASMVVGTVAPSPLNNDTASPTSTAEDPMRPRKQKVRFAGDIYTPHWVRYGGHQKEGYCEQCPKPGRWLQLKNSAYWYHKQFYHGISSVSGTYFASPLETRLVYVSTPTTPPTTPAQQSNPNAPTTTILVEGLCHQCNAFVPLMNSKRRGSTPPSTVAAAFHAAARAGEGTVETDPSNGALRYIARRDPASGSFRVPAALGPLPNQVVQEVGEIVGARGMSAMWFRHAHRCHVYHKPKSGGGASSAGSGDVGRRMSAPGSVGGWDGEAAGYGGAGASGYAQVAETLAQQGRREDGYRLQQQPRQMSQMHVQQQQGQQIPQQQQQHYQRMQ